MFIGPAVLEIWDGRLLGGFWWFLGERPRPAAITGQTRNQDPKIDQKSQKILKTKEFLKIAKNRAKTRRGIPPILENP